MNFPLVIYYQPYRGQVCLVTSFDVGKQAPSLPSLPPLPRLPFPLISYSPPPLRRLPPPSPPSSLPPSLSPLCFPLSLLSCLPRLPLPLLSLSLSPLSHLSLPRLSSSNLTLLFVKLFFTPSLDSVFTSDDLLPAGYQVYDPGQVPNGAKCAENKMCVNSKCTPVPEKPKQCHCSGNGVCNQHMQCHCDMGWAPPNCNKPGLGGSVTSNPPVIAGSNISVTVGTYGAVQGCISMPLSRHPPLSVARRCAAAAISAPPHRSA